MPHVVERQLGRTGQQVVYEGAPWTFRVCGVLLSTSSYQGLAAQAKFSVRDETGQDTSPTAADFRRGRVLFPRADRGHIDEVLQLLTQNTELDPILALAAEVQDDTSYFTPVGELQHELAPRREDRDQPEISPHHSRRADARGAIRHDAPPQPNGPGQSRAAGRHCALRKWRNRCAFRPTRASVQSRPRAAPPPAPRPPPHAQSPCRR